MALNPHIQAKAQAELDTILGPYTLPKLSDRDKLPYINAIVKESMRWHPVAPMGLPHLCEEGDVYDGYSIPKGAVVMGNIWYIPSSSSFPFLLFQCNVY